MYNIHPSTMRPKSKRTKQGVVKSGFPLAPQEEEEEEVFSSGSVLLCLHPLALMPAGELYGESVFNLRPN